MKEEKEARKEIMVLNEGIEAENLLGTESSCCFSFLMPFMDD